MNQPDGMSLLMETNGAIFLRDQIDRSFGYSNLDLIGQEAFVNHMHFSGQDRHALVEHTLGLWCADMKMYWPGKIFRVYQHNTKDETIIRFHLVRDGLPNWCDDSDSSLEISEIRT